MKLIVSILPFILLSVQALAAELNTTSQIMSAEGCLSKELIDDLQKDFKFIQNKNLQNFNLEPCDSKHITNRLFRGLAFLKYGRFNSSKRSHDEMFFDSFSKISPYDFFRSRIKSIEFDICPHTNFLAYSASGWDKFVVCINTFEKNQKTGSDQPAYYFSATAVHESRHTDSDDISHFTCTQGQDKGATGSCDRDRAQRGAYHYSVEYMIYLSRFGENFHPAMRQRARAGAIELLLNKFNTVPKIKTSKHLLLREQQEGRLLDVWSDQPIQTAGFFSPEKIFSRPDGDVLGYDPVTKVFSGWSYGIGTNDPTAGYAITYNKDIGQREPVMHYLATDPPENLVSSMIVGQTLKYAIYRENSDLVVDDSVILPFRGAQRLLKPALCNGAKDHVYVLTTDKTVYEGSLNNRNKMQFNPIANCEIEFLNVVPWKNSFLGLNVEGNLLELKEKSWTPVNSTVGKKFDFLSEPFDLYDFFAPQRK